ncbi:MAG: SCO family protein [Solirubrobacteraceae bacterium]
MRAKRRAWLERIGVACLALVAGLGLGACTSSSAPAFQLRNITGLLPALQLELTNQDGKPVTAADYRGKVVMLYFGYTHCPDVCPTTLAHLEAAIKTLGSAASRTRVLFVTVDPKRDTTAVLKSYVNFFGPQFVGLRGTPGELAALTKRYRVAYHLEPPDRFGNYSVDHSSAIFIFDGSGRSRLIGSETDSIKSLSHDLRQLIATA